MKATLKSIFVAAALCLTACDLMSDPDRSRLAGDYQLATVDGQALPWSAAPDSTGTTLTVLSGSLTLGAASPETYSFVPSGAMIPSKCVHAIPDGAWVDTANVVHLSNGSTYRIPPCGDGPYTLSLTRRYTDAGGSSHTAAETWTGLYAWGTDGGPGGTTYVTLVGRMAGTASTFASGVHISVAVGHVGPPSMWPHEPTYEFVPTH